MVCQFSPEWFRERRLDLEAGTSGVLAGPRCEESGTLGVRRLEDFQERRGDAVRRVWRLGNGVAGQELGCFRVKVELLKGADFPERLEPVIAAFAIKLPGVALEYSDVAGDVSRRGSVAEFEPLLCGLKEEVRVYIVEQGEDGVHPILGLPVEGVEYLGDPSLGNALQGGRQWLELFGADVGTEFVFELHRALFLRVLRPRWPWKEFKLLRLR